MTKGTFDMKSIAYYNGQTGAPEELTVPFNDRSHYFGDGVYDATMGANGKVFLLEEHLDRFYSSAASFQINVPMDRDELGALLTDLLAQVDGASQFVYWQVTRGNSGDRMHVFDPETPGIIWAFVTQEDMADPQQKLKLITRPDTRFEHCNVKTLNLLPSVMAAQAAHAAGADEAVLHRNGIVTECAHSNVLILKDDTLYSHPNDEFILRGIAKTHLIKAAYRAAIPVIERPFTLDELFDADEVIVTSSSHLCSIASEIDGEPVGGGDAASIRALLDIVFREYFDYCDLQKLN